MDTNQINIVASIAPKLLLGVQIFFVIRWFMENTEDFRVKIAIRFLQIQVTSKGIYEPTMLVLDAMPAQNAAKLLQLVLV